MDNENITTNLLFLSLYSTIILQLQILAIFQLIIGQKLLRHVRNW